VTGAAEEVRIGLGLRPPEARLHLQCILWGSRQGADQEAAVFLDLVTRYTTLSVSERAQCTMLWEQVGDHKRAEENYRSYLERAQTR